MHFQYLHKSKSFLLITKLTLLLNAISLFLFKSVAQENLYIPRNILSAFEKGTRSYDGKPGGEYWQNFSEYKINVNIDPYTYLIDGSEEIVYHNNSPDTLKKIVLRLYPNIFKKGSVRDYPIIPEGVTDGVTVKKIIIGNTEVDLQNPGSYKVVSTVATISLKEFIPPNSSENISIVWSFNLSAKATLRMGVYDSTTALVGYWYPQISVYDDIEGWDYQNYNGQVEFYNDFCSFDVKITLPDNFGVWATGELQNPEDVLGEEILQKYLKAKDSDTVVNIITTDNLNSPYIFKSKNKVNTWKFKAVNVTDFAFVFSDHYLWDGLTAVVDSISNEKVFVQSIYPVQSTDFFEVAQISKNLIQYYSIVFPGIKFPFPSFTAFNNRRTGGGGMEFPMMINDGSTDSKESTVSLTAHEIAHQYFPFYIGTNEKKYAFMDEGWASMLPFDYMLENSGTNKRLASGIKYYEKTAGTEDDVPPMISSVFLSYSSYRNAAYNRPSVAYYFLYDMLGKKIFLQALQEFVNRWKGRHPIPYDFFFTFNEVAGQNLNWFWKPWFFEIGYPDLKIDKVFLYDKKVKIEIKKAGTVPTPIKITLNYEDDKSENFYYSTEVWKNGEDLFPIETEIKGILKEIILGDELIPDSDRENNLYIVH